MQPYHGNNGDGAQPIDVLAVSRRNGLLGHEDQSVTGQVRVNMTVQLFTHSVPGRVIRPVVCSAATRGTSKPEIMAQTAH